MRSYGRWRTCPNILHANPLELCQSFGTDFKEVITIIKDPRAWPTFSMELVEFEAIKGRCHDSRSSTYQGPRTRRRMLSPGLRELFIEIYLLLIVPSRSGFPDHL
ncbi:hypothetical protein Bca4012_020224 [Brassica carinata]